MTKRAKAALEAEIAGLKKLIENCADEDTKASLEALLKKTEERAAAPAEEPAADPPKTDEGAAPAPPKADDDAEEGDDAESDPDTKDALEKTEDLHEGSGVEEMTTAADALRIAQERIAGKKPELAAQLAAWEQLIRAALVDMEAAEPAKIPTDAEVDAAVTKVTAGCRAFAAGKVHSKTDLAFIEVIRQATKAVGKAVKALLARQRTAQTEKKAKKATAWARVKAAVNKPAGKDLCQTLDAAAGALNVWGDEGEKLTPDAKFHMNAARSRLYEATSVLYRITSSEEELADPVGAITKCVEEAAAHLTGIADAAAAEMLAKLAVFSGSTVDDAKEVEPTEAAPDETADETPAEGEAGSAAAGAPKFRRRIQAAFTPAEDADYIVERGKTGVLFTLGTAVLVTETGRRDDPKKRISRAAIEGLAKTQAWRGLRIEKEHPTAEQEQTHPSGRVDATAGKLYGPIFTRVNSKGQAQALSKYMLWDQQMCSAFAAVQDANEKLRTQAGSELLTAPFEGSYDSWQFGHVEEASQEEVVDSFGKGFAFAIVVTGAHEGSGFSTRAAASDKSTPANPKEVPGMDPIEIARRLKQILGLCRAHMEAEGFSDRERAAAQVHIDTTYTTEAVTAALGEKATAAQKATLEVKEIENGLNAIRTRMAEAPPSSQSRDLSGLQIGKEVREKAAARAIALMTPEVNPYGAGLAGARQMATAYLADVGIKGENGRASLEASELLFKHALALGGRIGNLYHDESKTTLDTDKRKLGYFEPDPARRFAACASIVMAEAASDGTTFAWDSRLSKHERAAILTSDLPIALSTAINKHLAMEMEGESDGSGMSWKAPLEAILASPIAAKDFRQQVVLQVEKLGLFDAVAEGGVIGELEPIGDQSEVGNCEYFAGDVIISEHASRADRSELGTLANRPAEMKKSWERTKRRTFFGIVSANPNMADGLPIMSTARGNATNNPYDLDELFVRCEGLMGATAFGQGAGEEVEHLEQGIGCILTSLAAMFAIVRDVRDIHGIPNSPNLGTNAFVALFGGKVPVYAYSPWDTAGITDLIVLISKGFIHPIWLDGRPDLAVYTLDDPRLIGTAAELYRGIGGMGSIVDPNAHRVVQAFL